MRLYYSVRSPEGRTSNHCFSSRSFEDHLLLLNTWVICGHQLLLAFLIDTDGCRVNLPVEAFDGAPIGIHMRALEKEYQLLLSP